MSLSGASQLERDITGALRCAIAAHGPITKDRVGSATKRISGAVTSSFPYVWAWKGHDTQRQRTCIRRHGQRCRVVARGTMNSALIEFADGFRTVTSRNGLRRAR